MTRDGRGTLYCTERITAPERRALYRKLEQERVCQFCPEGIELGYVNILFELQHWYVTKNDPQYGGTFAHWTAISKKHHIGQNDVGAGDELFEIQRRFVQDNGVDAVCMVQRRGNMSRTCASMSHDHVHFAVAHEGKLGDKTFQMDLGYWPKCEGL